MVEPITVVAIAAGIAVAAMTLAMLWFVRDSMNEETHRPDEGHENGDADGNENGA
ncbi:hypothetical protein ACERIT_04295 [Halopenitus sp. H-Gu1]|uniref:hypothetical protein n=1 Tax=Halopenitus sp. H-Gu1 TaxID=3242697 RepID=UPI00359EC8F6